MQRPIWQRYLRRSLVLGLLLLSACAPEWTHGPPGPTPWDAPAWESGRAACAEKGLEYDGRGCISFYELCLRNGGIGVIHVDGHWACLQPAPVPGATQ